MSVTGTKMSTEHRKKVFSRLLDPDAITLLNMNEYHPLS